MSATTGKRAYPARNATPATINVPGLGPLEPGAEPVLIGPRLVASEPVQQLWALDAISIGEEVKNDPEFELPDPPQPPAEEAAADSAGDANTTTAGEGAGEQK